MRSTQAQLPPIRNIALLGHCGSGKSTLIEALLNEAGAITEHDEHRIINNTAQERQAEHSLETWLFHTRDQHSQINLIDTPGTTELFGRAVAVMPATESVALVINARQGIEPVTRKAFELLQTSHKCGLIVINQCDASDAKVSDTLLAIQQRFGAHCLPINLPSADYTTMVDCYFEPDYAADVAISSVTAAHERLVEQVIEVDDELMECYLEQGQSITPTQLHDPFEQCLREGHLLPVCFVSAKTGAGIAQLLRVINELMPTPAEGNPPLFFKRDLVHKVLQDDGLTITEPDTPVSVLPDPDAHVIAHVFKVVTDPFVGRIGMFRIHQGTVRTGSQLFIGDGRRAFRVNHLLKLQGNQSVEVDAAGPGDICAVARVDNIHFDAVLHDSHDEDHFYLQPLTFPAPMSALAVEATSHGDEQKLSDVLQRMAVEDPSFVISGMVAGQRTARNEMVISGLGRVHLQTILDKMQMVYHLNVTTRLPGIPYRETILKPASGHHRHKKQSGGSGQFGEVYLRIEPLPRGAGFEFASEVVGGVIPSQYLPAVEKGVREVMSSGAIAGYPMQDIRVVVYDGKHHSVDSKEIAFVTAGKKAFLDAISRAEPVLLEPYMALQVTTPVWSVGDITGHLSAERGLVTGSESKADGEVCIDAEVPLATVLEYSTVLRSMTSGEGEFTMVFSRYEQVPATIQQTLTTRH